MDTERLLTIDAYERLIEEFELQLLEIQVAREHAKRRQAELEVKFAQANKLSAKQLFIPHLDRYVEGISVLERNRIALENNLAYYQQRFDAFLEESQ